MMDMHEAAPASSTAIGRAPKGLYLPSGYLNFRWCLNLGVPFVFLVGARGVGKTYGGLSTCIEDNIKFFFLRRTQTQVDTISTPDYNPFKTINKDKHIDIGVKSITKNSAGFYHADADGKYSGAPVGYLAALSTFSNIRGFDASDVDLILFDEFIPEHHERPIKHEAEAFFNCYESINRNRELSGRPPVTAVCMANSNDIANPIFVHLGIVNKVNAMNKRGQVYTINKESGYAIILLSASPISAAKEETALYKLTKGSAFSEMALSNDFGVVESNTKSENLKEYIPIVTVGEITVYRHKSERRHYVTTHSSGHVRDTYQLSDADIKRLQIKYRRMVTEYLSNRIRFEDYACEVLFSRYFMGG